MHFGVLAVGQFEPDRDARTVFEGLTAQAELIEELAYDSLWLTEHHFLSDYTFFDIFQALSRLSAHAQDTRLGTAISTVPLYNPARLAERVANLDICCDGQFTFGAGVGYRREEFEILGIDRSTRGRRMDESLDLLEALWTEDGVSYDGSVFEFDDVTVNPKPVQDGGPPVWIGGTSAAGATRAAKRGDAWLAGATRSVSELREHYDTYDAALAEFGRQPEARPIVREGFVGETRSEALDIARPYLLEKHNRYLDWKGDDSSVSTADRFEEYASDRLLVGSPDDVIDGIQTLVDAFDVDSVLFRTQWPGLDQDVANDSIELFADEVVPSFD